MDRAFGKLRDSLTEMGIRDNTILWYTSDNGGLLKIGATGGRAYKGKVYDGGLLVPAILEWPAKVPKHRVTSSRCVTSDIYPTLLDIVGVKMPNQPVLDGISLMPLIEGKDGTRTTPIGIWDANEKGIGTPSDDWMAELMEAQKNGGDLPPHPVSAAAAELPSPAWPDDQYPGHSAWIDGDWKLHRITDKSGGNEKWELYNLKTDPMEEKNLVSDQSERVTKMKGELEAWLKSVVGSLNGKDY